VPVEDRLTVAPRGIAQLIGAEGRRTLQRQPSSTWAGAVRTRRQGRCGSGFGDLLKTTGRRWPERAAPPLERGPDRERGQVPRPPTLPNASGLSMASRHEEPDPGACTDMAGSDACADIGARLTR
jgi:hypothetical protein